MTPASRPQSRAGLQRAFIDHVAGPFLLGIVRLLPRLTPVAHRLAANRATWGDAPAADAEAEADAALLAAVADARHARILATAEAAAAAKAAAAAAETSPKWTGFYVG